MPNRKITRKYPDGRNFEVLVTEEEPKTNTIRAEVTTTTTEIEVPYYVVKEEPGATKALQNREIKEERRKTDE